MSIIDKVALIHIKDRKLLMAWSRGKDTFFFPGGKREPGESDEQALVREVQEELSVSILHGTIQFYGAFQTVAHGKPPGTMLHTKYYTACFEGTPQAGAEIERLVWVTMADTDQATEMGRLVMSDLYRKGLID